MTAEDFAALRRGDIVRHAVTGKTWIVASRTEDGEGLVLRRTQTAFNPAEWERVAPQSTALSPPHVRPQADTEADPE